MWLNAFNYKGKLLSESEFWILSLVNEEEFEAPSIIIERLIEQTLEWTPKAGTIYPILHRLADENLLEKIEDGGPKFRRGEQGSIFMSSITKPLKAQLSESCNYYQQVLTNLSKLDEMPARYDKILHNFSLLTKRFSSNLKELAEEVADKSDKSFDVPINFED